MKCYFFIPLLLLQLIGFAQIVPILDSVKGYQYRDTVSNVIISEHYYDQAAPFSDGMARVNRGGFWGFIDKTGKEVISCRYARAVDFNEGVGAVSIGKINIYPDFVSSSIEDEKFALIDKKGNYRSGFLFGDVSSFSDGLAIAKDLSSRQWGWIDNSGKWVINPIYISANGFDKYGMAKVGIQKTSVSNNVTSYGNFYGYINKKGEFLIQPEFYSLGDFVNNFVVATKEDTKGNFKMGYLNRTGKVIIEFLYDDAFDFSENIALVARKNKINNKLNFGYINTNGEELIPLEFEYARSFLDGLAFVRKSGKYGWVNKKGEFVISNKYDMAEDFQDPGFEKSFFKEPDIKRFNSALVSRDGFWGAINLSGEELVPIVYDSIAKARNGFMVLKGGSKLILNGQGQISSNLRLTDFKETNYHHNYRNNNYDSYNETLNSLSGANDNMELSMSFTLVKNSQNKYGLNNKNGTIFCPAIYDSIKAFFWDYESVTFICYINRRIDLISAKYLDSKPIFKSTSYSFAANKTKYSLQVNPYLRVVKDQKYGVVDVRNDYKEIVRPEFEDIGILPYHFGGKLLIPVKKNSKWGFFDASTNQIISDFQFDGTGGFNNRDNVNLCFVSKNKKWGIVDEDINLVTPFKYDDALCFAHELAGVKIGRKWGFVDYNGGQYTPFIFDQVNIHHEWKSCVKINKMEILIEEFCQWVY